MATRRRSKRDGPRQAVRWIGDAFVLEGDLATGAPAVWRGIQGDPRCARARLASIYDDWEFQEQRPSQLKASVVVGEGIVPRFATYRKEDTLAIIEADVADLTLRDLIEGLHDPTHPAGARAPIGLALYVARAIARACRSTTVHEGVALAMRPQQIDVAWDGTIYLRPGGFDDDDDFRYSLGVEAPDAVTYRAGTQRTIGTLVYTLLSGEHPYEAPSDERDDDDHVDDDDRTDEEMGPEERAEQIVARMNAGTHRPLHPRLGIPQGIVDWIDKLLAPTPPPYPSWDALLAAIEGMTATTLLVEPFAQADLAGMLRGLFDERRRACELERDDRLQVMPGPRVEPEEWPVFDADDPGDADVDPWVADLDDVRKGRNEETKYEPAVDPIDPFDDE